MTTRLESIAPELAAVLESAQPDKARQAAVDSAFLAVQRTAMKDPAIDAAVGALRSGQVGDSLERRGVEALTEALDEIQWRLQEQLEAGTSTEPEYTAAFRRARASSALWFALDQDPIRAALEAVYEAHAATDDLAALRFIVAKQVRG